MHAQIARVHPAIGAAFTYLSTEDVDLERLEAERRTEAKRNAAGLVPKAGVYVHSCQPSSWRSALRMTPSS